MKQFIFYEQLSEVDCGPSCLRMIATYYGKDYTAEQLERLSGISKEGVSLLGLRRAAERIGFRAVAVKLTFEQLDEETKLPCILHWGKKHFVVIPPQDYSSDDPEAKIKVADPRRGMMDFDKEKFLKMWLKPVDGLGVALALEPTKEFYSNDPSTIISWQQK